MGRGLAKSEVLLEEAAVSGGVMVIADARSSPELGAIACGWEFGEWAHKTSSAESHRRWYYREILGSPPSKPFPICLVGTIDGAPAGMASVYEDDGLAAPYNQRSGVSPWIASVYTDPGHRGRRVASTLVSRCLRLATAEGVAAIHLFTPDQEKLYERLGFDRIAETKTPRVGERVTVMRRRFDD